MVGLGIGLIGASFMLAWAADAGEAVFSGGLVLAVVALVAVLPEFVIEIRFAFIQAGRARHRQSDRCDPPPADRRDRPAAARRVPRPPRPAKRHRRSSSPTTGGWSSGSCWSRRSSRSRSWSAGTSDGLRRDRPPRALRPLRATRAGHAGRGARRRRRRLPACFPFRRGIGGSRSPALIVVAGAVVLIDREPVRGRASRDRDLARHRPLPADPVGGPGGHRGARVRHRRRPGRQPPSRPGTRAASSPRR